MATTADAKYWKLQDRETGLLTKGSIMTNFRIQFVCFIFCLGIGAPAFGNELDRNKHELDEVATQASYWQYGWASFFLGSLALQARTLANDSTSRKQKFDAKVSVVTSGSGLLSTLINPLPAAFLGEFHGSPESTTAEREAKAAMGQRILDDTRLEIVRRRSTGFQIFVLTEQFLAAAAVAWLDKRPQDAGRRFLLGMAGSELFIFTTPWIGSSPEAGQVTWQILPNGIAFDLKF